MPAAFACRPFALRQPYAEPGCTDTQVMATSALLLEQCLSCPLLKLVSASLVQFHEYLNKKTLNPTIFPKF